MNDALLPLPGNLHVQAYTYTCSGTLVSSLAWTSKYNSKLQTHPQVVVHLVSRN